jgi:hypothetical protein
MTGDYTQVFQNLPLIGSAFGSQYKTICRVLIGANNHIPETGYMIVVLITMICMLGK